MGVVIEVEQIEAKEYLEKHGVQKALEEAIAKVVQDKPENALAAIADMLKPPPQSPIDTRSPEAFNADLAAKGVAAVHLNLIGLGDELGYFKSLLEAPKSSNSLAEATGCSPRYTKEWCLAMAAGKVLDYDSEKDLFAVPAALADCVVPTMNPSGLIWATLIPAVTDMRAKFVEVYKTGEGIDWSERDPRLGKATCNFFKPLYEGMLVSAIPDDIKAKLTAGGSLADVGCGQGLSTILMAKTFPNSTFVGYDYYAPSIDAAKEAAAEAGVTNVTFEVSNAADFGSQEGQFDFACFLDCWHDMAVAGLAAKRAAFAVKQGGAVFLIEPMAAANDSVKEQLALPSTVMYAAFSCQVCLCCSSVNGGDALGAVCPTAKHRELFTAGGFLSLEAVESPINTAGFRFMVAKI